MALVSLFSEVVGVIWNVGAKSFTWNASILAELLSRLLDRLALLFLRLRDCGRSRCSGGGCTGGSTGVLRSWLISSLTARFFLNDEGR